MARQLNGYTVIGSGHGGKAMAAHLGMRGFPVRLYNRTAERLKAIKIRQGIGLTLHDQEEGFAPLELTSSDIGFAVRDSKVIMVVIPATGHREIAEKCAPHLRDGQIVLLNPGRTGGALEFKNTLHRCGCEADVIVAEAQTFVMASRSMGPAEAKIFRIKNTVPLAALPAKRTPEVLAALEEAYPQFIAAPNVLYTSLNNIGAVFHPALTLLNAGRIESTLGDFEFYIDGVTRSVAKVLETLDRERMTVAAMLGIRAISALEWLEEAYAATGSNLMEAIRNNPGYVGIKAPRTLEHRYIFEDVPMSLVPISNLGTRFGVSTRAMDSIILMARIVHGTDYQERGRSVADLGLENLTVAEIQHYVEQGVLPDRSWAK
jgi:opine dehydrogenase